MSPAGSEEKSQTEGSSQQAAAAKAKPSPANAAPRAKASPSQHGVEGQFRDWIRDEGAWWAASFVFHTLLMACLMLIPHTVVQPSEGEAPTLTDANMDNTQTPQMERFEMGETKVDDPGDLSTDSLSMTKAPDVKASDIDLKNTGLEGGGYKGAPNGPSLGGMGGFTIAGLGVGSARRGPGGVGFGAGFGNSPGSGGANVGFGQRTGRKSLGAQGGTKISERAVGAALSWFARHQSRDGSWGLADYRRQCKDPSCTGPGTYAGGAAGTAMALLPFLAAGQTHETKGPYRNNIYNGLGYLMRNQARSGDLSGANPPAMYVHGLCSITLCEAYGLTHNRKIGAAAQQAINFIQSAQNPGTGGWRYNPGQDGDTSVVGWQVMALKSAHMAGLQVNANTLKGADRFLKSCAKGKGGQFSYTPDAGPSPSMTAVGLLCLQYGGMKRSDPQLADGVTMLMQNMPSPGGRNVYYWYYATQVMHNVNGPDWDTWNRGIRRVLLDSQCKTGCATGSWDPDKPSKEPFGDVGGRVFVTSLSTLTLEVYYRYLPLYKLGNTDAVGTLAAPPPPPPPTSPPPKPGAATPKPATPAAPAKPGEAPKAAPAPPPAAPAKK